MRADLPRRGGPSAEGPRPRGAPAWPAIGFMAGSKPPLSPWQGGGQFCEAKGFPRGPAAWAGWGPLPMTLAALRERKACAPRSLGFRRRFLTPYPGGQGQPRFRREQRAGWADAPLPGPAAQGAPILPGGQWRPGFGRESSGRPGRHPPLEGCRLARGPGGLPGRSLSLSLGRESEARTSGSTGVS